MTWIMIGDDVYLTDTDDEVAAAQAALRQAGQAEARVYVGDPDSPDTYPNGEILFADVSPTGRRRMPQTLQWHRSLDPRQARTVAYRLIDPATGEELEHLSGWRDSARSMEDLGDRRARLSTRYEAQGYRVVEPDDEE